MISNILIMDESRYGQMQKQKRDISVTYMLDTLIIMCDETFKYIKSRQGFSTTTSFPKEEFDTHIGIIDAYSRLCNMERDDSVAEKIQTLMKDIELANERY